MPTILAGLGLDFLKDLVKDNGEALVKEGIKKVTGIDLNSKKELTPAQALIIKEAELKLKEFDFKALELDTQDRGSARHLQEVALGQDDVFSKRFVYYFASFITGVTFLYIFLITFIAIPPSNIRFADTTLGFLLGVCLATIVGFFYGSSTGSKSKTEALVKLQEFVGAKE